MIGENVYLSLRELHIDPFYKSCYGGESSVVFNEH